MISIGLLLSINHTLVGMVVIAWATCFLFCATYLDTAPHFIVVSQFSVLQLEANALLASGWWGRTMMIIFKGEGMLQIS
jgi:hypothetical protein